VGRCRADESSGHQFREVENSLRIECIQCVLTRNLHDGETGARMRKPRAALMSKAHRPAGPVGRRGASAPCRFVGARARTTGRPSERRLGCAAMDGAHRLAAVGDPVFASTPAGPDSCAALSKPASKPPRDAGCVASPAGRKAAIERHASRAHCHRNPAETRVECAVDPTAGVMNSSPVAEPAPIRVGSRGRA
jgi:hypothetical protein